MSWRFWRKRERVLEIGYAPQITGGVTKIMGLLQDRISYIDLHVALRYYQPTWKVVCFTLGSFLGCSVRLVTKPPRIVHVIIGSPGDALRMIPFILAGRLRGCRVCLHFHKNYAGIFDGLPRPFAHVVLAVWSQVDGCVFLSERLRDEFCGRIGGKPTLVVIPNPISQDWLDLPTKNLVERTNDVAFFGRWSPEKGVDELVSVMTQLRDSPPDLRCHIYSDARPENAPNNCIFHGWIDEQGVKEVLGRVKLLLLPSHAEAYPTVLLEAAACGTPFVSTAIAGIPDIAEQSDAGLLHDPGNVDGMQKVIEQLLDDEQLWNRCSEGGVRWIRTLNVARVVPLWHQFYGALGLDSRYFELTTHDS